MIISMIFIEFPKSITLGKKRKEKKNVNVKFENRENKLGFG